MDVNATVEQPRLMIEVGGGYPLVANAIECRQMKDHPLLN
jgi:hypothetical protein